MSDETPKAESPSYLFGLDLGQQSDFTAGAVLERTQVPDPERPDKKANHYTVRWLRRWPLGTSYVEIVAAVVKVLKTPPLVGCSFVLDATGCGRPVADQFARADHQAKRLTRLTITGGKSVSAVGDELHASKHHVASTLRVLFGHDRLKISPRLAETATLVAELRNFTEKISQAGNVTYESWREAEHDDLVLAVGIAAFVGERSGPRFILEAVKRSRDEVTAGQVNIGHQQVNMGGAGLG